MSPRRTDPTRADLLLLHEALVYARRRAYAPADAIRLQGILQRVEDLLLEREPGAVPPPAPRGLRLSPPEQEVLEKEIVLYCQALTERGGSAQGARDAARLREILPDLTGRRPWWRRLIGR